MPNTPLTKLGTRLDRLYTKTDAFALMMVNFESIHTIMLQLEDLNASHDATLITANNSFFLTLKDFLGQIAVPDKSTNSYLSV